MISLGHTTDFQDLNPGCPSAKTGVLSPVVTHLYPVSSNFVIYSIMHLLDRCLLVWPAPKPLLDSLPRSTRRRWKKAWWQEATLIICFIFDQTKVLASSMTTLPISCQICPKWLQAISQKKARQRFTTMREKEMLRLWPHLISLSLKVPGWLKGQGNHFPLSMKTPFLAIGKGDILTWINSRGHLLMTRNISDKANTIISKY